MENLQQTPKRRGYETPTRPRRSQTPSLKALENLNLVNSGALENLDVTLRRSGRKNSPSKRYGNDFITGESRTPKKRINYTEQKDTDSNDDEFLERENDNNLKDLELVNDDDVAGKNLYGFSTPRKQNSMLKMVLNTPKTPRSSTKTPESKRQRHLDIQSKTPSHLRNKVKKEILKHVQDLSDLDFSSEESEYHPDEDENETSSSQEEKIVSENSDESTNKMKQEKSKPNRKSTSLAALSKTPISNRKTSSRLKISKENETSSSEEEEIVSENSDESTNKMKQEKSKPNRKSISLAALSKTPISNRRTSSRLKISKDFIPESDGYFNVHSKAKNLTSDHTLDRLKNPRLSADRLFTLLNSMKLTDVHEQAVTSLLDEYQSNFAKWIYILNEGYNILLYGLGSKRSLLENFHKKLIEDQNVIVVNGFFPSLTIKDILESIGRDILDLESIPSNAHEAVNAFEEEFKQMSDAHIFLIVHNIDGPMLRNSKAQDILSRLANISNVHLLASVDHINTPLLWDHIKLRNFNFSWWDSTTLLPYTDETAFENSLLVQNSGALALSSMRNVFQSLTSNSRGIYMLIVKHQLKSSGISNYQGMPFKDLYYACREGFLVSSDSALRAQLTEFLDHKLVRTKRSMDGSELLQIPIDSGLLQQFLEEQE